MIGFMLFFVLILSPCAYGVLSFFVARLCEWRRGDRAISWRVRLGKLVAALLLGVLGYVCKLVALILLFLLVLLYLSRLVAWMIRKIVGEREGALIRSLQMVYRLGLIPLLMVAAMLIGGFIRMNTVVQTAYTVSSNKLDRDYRVVFLSDIHYATVQDTALIAEKVAEINAIEPDLIILGGDILDEGTAMSDMQACFAALGGLRSTYGTYFIYGNHDRQRYSDAPTYTEEALAETIETNGITILREDIIPIGDDLLLLGREDLGAADDRLPTDTLKAAIDPDRFLLVADHQPNDEADNGDLGTDLQLSGHTHSGQIFPAGHLTFFFQGYVYGRYETGGMTVLVSSGFAGWGFPIRTQARSEYLLVELVAD